MTDFAIPTTHKPQFSQRDVPNTNTAPHSADTAVCKQCMKKQSCWRAFNDRRQVQHVEVHVYRYRTLSYTTRFPPPRPPAISFAL